MATLGSDVLVMICYTPSKELIQEEAVRVLSPPVMDKGQFRVTLSDMACALISALCSQPERDSLVRVPDCTNCKLAWSNTGAAKTPNLDFLP